MSVGGGLHTAFQRAEDAGCDTMAVFSGSPRVWARRFPDSRRIEAYQAARSQSAIDPVILHALYLANLASADTALRTQSVEAVTAEISIAHSLSIHIVVLHPGNHRGTDIHLGIRNIAEALNIIFDRTPRNTGIALETMSGGTNSVGGRFEHLRDIIAEVRVPERVTVCLDTCHIFAAGYDFRTPAHWQAVRNELDRCIGLDRVSVIHLNDSLGTLGSGKDRHTHIGQGQIGLDGFRNLVCEERLKDIPMILETPKDGSGELDRKNLSVLRALLDGSGK